MPQYKKVFDVGTYAGVSGYTRVGIPTLRTPGAGGKQVAKSLRFRAANSAYLSRTSGTSTNTKIATLSFWMKSAPSISSVVQPAIWGNTSNNGIVAWNTTSYGGKLFVRTDATNDVLYPVLFKDPSVWQHIVIAVDTTQATGSNRVKVYVNSILQTASSGTAALDSTNFNSSSTVFNIGRDIANNYYWDGYLAEYYFIDGQALTPSSFGEYNSDNIWVPKAYSGSYGTNGFYLDFSDVALTSGSNAGYGKDTSGNGNYWNTNGLSVTAGTTYDSMIDSPTDWDNSGVITGNYATLNPAQTTPSGSFSEGNLKFTTAAAWGGSRATIAIPATGKWYAEFTLGSTSSNSAQGDVGIFPTTLTNDYDWTGAYGLEVNNGFFLVTNGSYSSNAGVTIAGGSVMQIAVDADAGKVWFGKGNAWYDTYNTTNGNPSSGTNPSGSSINFAAVQYAMGIKAAGNNWTANFGQRTFVHTPPTGFKALNTKNITRPTDANMWFYGDTPDLMWIKNRSATSNHSLTDTVRGVGLGLTTNTTPTVENGDQDVAEMNKFGMTLIGASSRTTAASNNFVYWGWKGGGATTVTNTQGSITSQVSANVAAGFSIVSYTGTGATGGTVGHGLGAAPSLILAKARPQALNWIVYTAVTGKDKYLLLDTNAAATTTSNVWGSSAPTANVFGVFPFSTSGNNYPSVANVAYCWTPIAGFSSFGSFVGNGSDDGPYVFTGFRCRYIILKTSTLSGAAYDWYIYDTARNTYNVTNNFLQSNYTGAENIISSGASYSDVNIDILSNGFKIRRAYGAINALNETYVYAAFAEHPFKIARAR